jgi:hypothetical protein
LDRWAKSLAIQGLSPSSTQKELASKPIWAPESTAASSSTIRANIALREDRGDRRRRVADQVPGDADRLDVPSRAEVIAVGDTGKSDAVFDRAFACSTASRNPASSRIEVNVSIPSLWTSAPASSRGSRVVRRCLPRNSPEC